MASERRNYYSNPAFCQQSEFVGSPQRTRALSPERRQSPVGAHVQNHQSEEYVGSPPKPGPKPKKTVIEYEEDYEEMLVDDSFTNDQQNGNYYRPKGRYAIVPMDEVDNGKQKHRYEYIPMTEHVSPRSRSVDEVEIARGRVHRYAVIPDDEEKPKTRYALVPVDEVNNKNGRYDYIPVNDDNGNTRHTTKNRYDYIPPQEIIRKEHPQEYYPQTPPKVRVTSPHTPRKGNPEATQKLHAFLATPTKPPNTTPQKVMSPTSRRALSPQPDPFQTPKKTPPKTSRTHTPKAQQKLNYTLSTRQSYTEGKRNTAVITPICSSPVQSVYSETTYSQKTESWMNLSSQKSSAAAHITVAAVMTILCGGVSAGLCFYMISILGSTYFLNLGVVAGFACFSLGVIGYRSRNCQWMPNRNYISGYMVMSAFSLLTCACLLVLLFLQPKPGSPLADVTSGAVCGLSGLSLILASAGVLVSYCIKYPPPDNRVQHCARGFVV